MSLSPFSLPLPAINSSKRSVGSVETSLGAATKNPFLFGNSRWWQAKGEKCQTQLLFSFFFFLFSLVFSKPTSEAKSGGGGGRRRRGDDWGLVAHTLSPAWHGYDILSDGALKKKNPAEEQVTQSASVRPCGRVLACVFLACA